MSSLRKYHEATKHSIDSVSSSTHRLDWTNKPLAFKVYTTLERIEPPDDLGRLCRYTNGILRWRRDASGETYGFRAAPCTGALYHIELYLIWADDPALPAGVYHYSAHDDGLRRLREGDLRGVVIDATAGYEPVRHAPLTMVLTSTFWRNSWKYQARTYRHSYWDSGVILANLLALLRSDRTSASLVMGFVDDTVNHLVGADGKEEVALALVAVGKGAAPPPSVASLPALDYVTAPLSARPIRYQAIVDAHQASCLESREAVAAWRAAIETR